MDTGILDLRFTIYDLAETSERRALLGTSLRDVLAQQCSALHRGF
jgi:hypothetical protein